MRPSRLIESRPAIASEARKKMCPFSASARIVSRPGTASALNETERSGTRMRPRSCLRMRVTYTPRRAVLSHELSKNRKARKSRNHETTKPRNHETTKGRCHEGSKARRTGDWHAVRRAARRADAGQEAAVNESG